MAVIKATINRQILRSPSPNSIDISIIEQAEIIESNGDGGLCVSSGIRHQASSCGCSEGPGGFCHTCMTEGADGITCITCFHRCSASGCGIGLCLLHSFQKEDPPGELRRYCSACHKKLIRTQRKRRLIRFMLFPFRLLLSVFVIFEEQEDVRLPKQQIEIHPLRPTHPRHIPFEINNQSPQQRTNSK